LLRVIRYLIPALVLFSLTGASQASAASASGGSGSGTDNSQTTTAPDSGSTEGGTGGAGVGMPPAGPSSPTQPTVPGFKAKIKNGRAYAPSNAPIQVKKAIWAGDQIRRKPYVYGGGHGVWKDFGYDCSGSVSYVLHAAGLLKTSMDSSSFESWGQSGSGQWITVYTNPAHAFVEIAGIRLDTSAEDDPHPAPGSGPRWRPVMHATSAYMSRHPGSL
jgi:cell wall-associated NlpC family hydrolase